MIPTVYDPKSTASTLIKLSDMEWGSMRLAASIILILSVELMQTYSGVALLAPEQENALEVLRDSFRLPNWTGDPCSSGAVDWILCSNSSKSSSTNVESILLKSRNLTGTIPNAISKLRYLRELYLDRNKLFGVVPDLRNMTGLQFLDLSENNFTGPVPNTTTMMNLTQAVLSGCNFTGGIPRALFQHKTLEKLRLDNSSLGGPVPDLSGLTQMKEIYLAQTRLVGRIPDSIKNMTRATHIEFKTNPNITGPLPDLNVLFNVMYWDSSNCTINGPLPEFKNSANLQGLQLWNNNFSGPIPPALFRHELLQWVDMYNNPFVTGEVPDVSGLKSVEVFKIYNCSLTGPLPSFRNNTKLRFLNLRNNNLTKFEDDLRTLYQLSTVEVRNNSISGSLPDLPPSSIQVLKENYCLQKLKFSNNSFSGEIPVSWKDLHYLEMILLDQNNLTGDILQYLGNWTMIKTLDLSDNKFFGTIPEVIGNLTRLETLDLRNNQFSGAVPESLAKISTLQHVWLDNNSFTSLPRALITKLGANISFSGNSNIQIIRGKSANSSSGLSGGAIVGIVIGALGVAIAVLAILLYMRKRRMSSGYQLSIEDMPKSAKAFSWKEIKHISGNMKTLIGKGGFGPVYYGKLSDGKEVAVKVRATDSKQGGGEFLNEVRLLSRLHHRNIVPLVGYCLESRQQVLLYDYMSQGTLNHHLHSKVSPLSSPSDTTSEQSLMQSVRVQPLSWKVRVGIAIDAGRGIEYLHKDCNPTIIHRDVKSSNILLGDKLQAKITDLGISKPTPELEDQDMEWKTMNGVSTAVKGTIGYLDPEYFIRRKLTTKSDVYSFGIVLLEMVTGKRPHSIDFPESSETNLIDWVGNAVNIHDLDSIVDPTLKGGYNELGLLMVAQIALLCVSPSCGDRPEMGYVLNTLTEALQMEGGNTDSEGFDLKIASFDALPNTEVDPFSFTTESLQSTDSTVSTVTYPTQ